MPTPTGDTTPDRITSRSPSGVTTLPLLRSPLSLTGFDIHAYYDNLRSELVAIDFPTAEKGAVTDSVCGTGRLFESREYFHNAYALPLSRAINLIFTPTRLPRLLDLCCGTGVQSILFAELGAQVTAVDNDAGRLSVANKRLHYYRTALARRLDLEFVERDVVESGLRGLGQFDAIYSHFGIGSIYGPDQLFNTSKSILAQDGVLVLKAGNPRHLVRRVRGKSLPDSSIAEYRAAAHRHGFRVLLTRGSTVSPRHFRRFCALARPLDNALSGRESLFLQLEPFWFL